MNKPNTRKGHYQVLLCRLNAAILRCDERYNKFSHAKDNTSLSKYSIEAHKKLLDMSIEESKLCFEELINYKYKHEVRYYAIDS